MNKITLFSLKAMGLIGLVCSPLAMAQIMIGQTAGFTGPVGAGVKETTDGAKKFTLTASTLKVASTGKKLNSYLWTTSSIPSSQLKMLGS
jgi:hypothetical protein